MSIVKACEKDDIPTKVIKMNKGIFSGFIAKDFNNCVGKGVLPHDLKHADVTPVHEKKDKWQNQLQACKYTSIYLKNIWKINL